MPRKPRQKIHGECPRVIVVATRRKRSPEELQRIESALNESIMVVESPLIKKRNAEKVIFEEPDSVPRMSVAWYAP